MWIKVAQFIWNHFWKMVSALLVIGFWAFVDSVQQPEKVQARIFTLETQYEFLHNEDIQLKIGLGTNNQLFNNIDNKLTKLMENQAMLSQEVMRLNKR